VNQRTSGRRIPHWSTWLIVAVGLWCSAAFLWQHFRWGPAHYASVINSWVYPPLLAATAALAWRAGHTQGAHPRVRRGWKLIAMANLTFGIACSVLLVHALQGVYLFPSLADALFFLYYPLMMCGLLSLPFSPACTLSRVMFWIDVGMVAASGFVVIWLFVLGPTINASHDSLLAKSVTIAYPLADLVLLVGLIVTWLRRKTGDGSWLTLLCLGTLGLISADTYWGYLTHLGAYEQGSLPDTLWTLAYLLFALGAHMQADRQEGPVQMTEQEAPGPAGYRSYATVTISYVICLGVIGYYYSHVDPLVYAAFIVLSCLVIGRLAIMSRSNTEAERDRRSMEARFRALVQNAADVISIVSPGGQMIYQSPTAEKVFGSAPGFPAECQVWDLFHPDDGKLMRTALAEVIECPDLIKRTELRSARLDGSWRHVEVVMQNMIPDPDVGGIVLHTRDITERIKLEQVIRYQATHDGLTGLHNRTWLVDCLDQAVQGQSGAEGSLAILIIDLDGFKEVNDTEGHLAGDHVLMKVAARLREAVEIAALARLGGDEFAVLLQSAAGASAEAVADQILTALAAPITTHGSEFVIGASIGIAHSHRETPARELLRHADAAMYAAKRNGKNRWVTFHPDLLSLTEPRLAVSIELRRALDRQELALRYQPICDMRTERLTGLEALVRWNHPVRGLLPPHTFLHTAEETGLIVPVGRWVLAESCRQLSEWKRDFPAAADLTIHINLSVRELGEPNLVDAVREALSQSCLEPGALVLEITESMWEPWAEPFLANLNAIKALGVLIAIDDFGSGYSSFSRLCRYPVDIMKIDKSLVAQLETDSRQHDLVRGLVDLAGSLGLRTVCEGVERPAQKRELLLLGCQMGQGYGYAGPEDARAIAVRLGRAQAMV